MHNVNLPKLTGVSHSFIEVDGFQMHVAEIGKGKPLVLLHGWPQHWYAWRKIVPFLKNDFRLIMPDMRGFGWSEAPLQGNYNKERLATDLLGLLNALKLKRVGLVGHDWGGWVGFLACLREPKRFETFIALGILHPFLKLNHSVINFWRAAYQIPVALPLLGQKLVANPYLIEKSLMAVSYQKGIWTEEALLIYSRVLQQPERAKASSLLYRTFLTQEIIPVVKGKYHSKRLTVPTKLLIGSDDPIITWGQIDGYQNYSQDMSASVIKDCGHLIPEEQPSMVAEEITRVLLG